MTHFNVSGFADEIDESLDRQICGLKELGIKNAEVRFVDGINIADMSSGDAAVLAKQLQYNGISVSAIGSPLGKTAVDGILSEILEKAERCFDNAALLGAKYIRIFSFYPAKDGTHDEAAVCERLNKLISLGEKYGLTLCLENENRVFGESPEKALLLLRVFEGRLKAVFDMGNFVLDGYDPLYCYGILKDYIAYFHIKDATKSGIIVPAGDGDAHIRDILLDYAKSHDSVTVSLEPHLADFKGLGNLTSAELRKNKVYDTPKDAFFDSANRFLRMVGEIDENLLH